MLVLKHCSTRRGSLLFYFVVSEVFDEIDVDGSGQIDYDEFKRMITTFGITMTPVKLKNLFDYFDVTRKGHIGFNEFVSGFFPDEDLNIYDYDIDVRKQILIKLQTS